MTLICLTNSVKNSIQFGNTLQTLTLYWFLWPFRILYISFFSIWKKTGLLCKFRSKWKIKTNRKKQESGYCRSWTRWECPNFACPVFLIRVSYILSKAVFTKSIAAYSGLLYRSLLSSTGKEVNAEKSVLTGAHSIDTDLSLQLHPNTLKRSTRGSAKEKIPSWQLKV